MTARNEPQEQLFLVATPIGNLRDITLRALDVFRHVDYIAAEDTRRTYQLLQAYHIDKPILSYHEHNYKRAGEKIFKLIDEGKKVALVSDAGMPSLSDPGRDLVLQAIQKNIAYTVLPGASAGLTALVYSGLPMDSYLYQGFLPVKKNQRLIILQQLAQEKRTLVFFEAPHRIFTTLDDFVQVFGPDRHCVLVRELTKIYEEAIRGSLEQIISDLQNQNIRGEFVILLSGYQEEIIRPSEQALVIEFSDLIESGKSKSDSIAMLAQKYKIKKQELYLLFQKADKTEKEG